jgi:hypothetical protein
MTKAVVTKTGNSYALRVPKGYITDNNLKLGDVVYVEDPLDRQNKALSDLMIYARRAGAVKSITDPVAWQKAQRVSTSPWDEVKYGLAR